MRTLRSTTPATVLVALALAFGAGCGGGGGTTPDGGGGDGDVPITLRAPAGLSLFQSTGEARLALPADYFGPGSDPFEGQVALVGRPRGSAGPFEMGTTDCVIERLGALAMPDPPSEQEIAIELVELSLEGLAPLEVTYGMGPAEAWEVTVELDVDPALRLDGALQGKRLEDGGGTFEAQLAIRPVFVFRRPPRELTLHAGELTLTGTDGAWSLTPPGAWPAKALPPLGCTVEGSILLTSPLLDLALGPAEEDPTRPGPTVIDPTAEIDPDVASLGRYCRIAASVSIGEGVVVGPDAQIGPGVVLEPHACIGSSVVLGENAVVGRGSVVGDGSTIGAYTTIGDDAYVGDSTMAGAGCTIGEGCRLGTAWGLGDGATLGDGVRGGEAVVIGVDASVGAGLYLHTGASVPDGTVQSESIVLCRYYAGGPVLEPLRLAGDPVDPGAVLGLVCGFQGPVVGIPPPARTVTPIDPGSLPTDLKDLAADVGKDVAPPANGGTGSPYVEDTYDCDDFAESLRKKLAGKGYDTTFTVIYDVNPNRASWQFWKPKLINGHCLTDVHAADGKLIWLEPQYTGTGGALRARTVWGLDANGDGKVTYAEGPGSKGTDGTKRIEVYDSAEDAEDSGRDLD